MITLKSDITQNNSIFERNYFKLLKYFYFIGFISSQVHFSRILLLTRYVCAILNEILIIFYFYCFINLF